MIGFHFFNLINNTNFLQKTFSALMFGPQAIYAQLKNHEKRVNLLRSFCIYQSDLENYSSLTPIEKCNIAFPFYLYDSSFLNDLRRALAMLKCEKTAILYTHIYHLPDK